MYDDDKNEKKVVSVYLMHSLYIFQHTFKQCIRRHLVVYVSKGAEYATCTYTNIKCIINLFHDSIKTHCLTSLDLCSWNLQ